MKNMKGVVVGSSMEKSKAPSFAVYEDPRARFRHQSLMQDYEELLKVSPLLGLIRSVGNLFGILWWVFFCFGFGRKRDQVFMRLKMVFYITLFVLWMFSFVLLELYGLCWIIKEEKKKWNLDPHALISIGKLLCLNIQSLIIRIKINEFYINEIEASRFIEFGMASNWICYQFFFFNFWWNWPSPFDLCILFIICEYDLLKAFFFFIVYWEIHLFCMIFVIKVF